LHYCGLNPRVSNTFFFIMYQGTQNGYIMLGLSFVRFQEDACPFFVRQEPNSTCGIIPRPIIDPDPPQDLHTLSRLGDIAEFLVMASKLCHQPRVNIRLFPRGQAFLFVLPLYVRDRTKAGHMSAL
jgi:hypothetical protein